MPSDSTPSACSRSARRGCTALAHRRRTFPGVSSPESVVRSIIVMARSSQPACHSFFTVRRVGIVAARRSTALRFTRIARTQSRSSGVPGLRTGSRCASSRADNGFARRSRISGGGMAGIYNRGMREARRATRLARSVATTGTDLGWAADLVSDCGIPTGPRVARRASRIPLPILFHERAQRRRARAELLVWQVHQRRGYCVVELVHLRRARTHE